MPFSPFTRVSFGGDITTPGEPVEHWNCNVSVQLGEGPVPVGEDQLYIDEIWDPLGSWFSTASWCSSNATLLYVKANLINAAGSYDDASSVYVHNYDGGGRVGHKPPLCPSIMSCATSWTTAKSRGPGAHGRIYLPNYTVGLAGTMQVSPAYQQGVLDAGVALMAVLRNRTAGAGGVTAIPVVASKVNATNTPITGVRVGDIMDEQRRRKNGYSEVYKTTALAP